MFAPLITGIIRFQLRWFSFELDHARSARMGNYCNKSRLNSIDGYAFIDVFRSI
jgi:hypothetical protein